MKPKPKKIIEDSMDDTEPITDDEETNEGAGSGGDAFDALFSTNASPGKSNGKSAPSPVKGLDSSDDENDGHNDTATSADEKNESTASSGKADEDDANDTSQTDEDTANTNGTANGDDDAEDDEGWEVEAIVGHKMKNGRRLFRVRWKNYTEADDTWQGEDDLSW